MINRLMKINNPGARKAIDLLLGGECYPEEIYIVSINGGPLIPIACRNINNIKTKGTDPVVITTTILHRWVDEMERKKGHEK